MALDQLGAPMAVVNPAPRENMPNRGGPQRPGDSNAFISGLLGVLSQFPEAGTQGLGILQNVMSSIGAQQQQQQAATQQRRSDYSGLISNAAMQPGMTPEMLGALANANYPNLAQGKFGQNALEGLSNALPTSASTLDASDLLAIGNTVKTAQDAYNADPTTAPDRATTISQVINQLKALGYGDQDIAKAQQYLDATWPVGGVASVGTDYSNPIANSMSHPISGPFLLNNPAFPNPAYPIMKGIDAAKAGGSPMGLGSLTGLGGGLEGLVGGRVDLIRRLAQQQQGG